MKHLQNTFAYAAVFFAAGLLAYAEFRHTPKVVRAFQSKHPDAYLPYGVAVLLDGYVGAYVIYSLPIAVVLIYLASIRFVPLRSPIVLAIQGAIVGIAAVSYAWLLSLLVFAI